jgi:pSer/pThr/pTyr-binding forkhead associated (FHA) protein
MMEKYNEEVALLLAQAGPLIGQRWALNNIVFLGREADCEIVIPNRQVSRHHARLSQTVDGFRLEDLGSKNGTHLNGKPLQGNVILKDGDLIQIALAQKFVFFSSDATVPLEFNRGDYQSQVPYPASSQPQASETAGEPAKQAVSRRLVLEKRSRRVWIFVKQASLPVENEDAPGYKEIEVEPPLSASQFRLLELLYEEAGRVVSREELVANVWGTDQAIGVSEQAFDALVRRLRDRLAGFDPTHPFIVTVRGHGLRLNNPLL